MAGVNIVEAEWSRNTKRLGRNQAVTKRQPTLSTYGGYPSAVYPAADASIPAEAGGVRTTSAAINAWQVDKL